MTVDHAKMNATNVGITLYKREHDTVIHQLTNATLDDVIHRTIAWPAPAAESVYSTEQIDKSTDQSIDESMCNSFNRSTDEL